jgi:tripartite-type tricarboxylate transporter receptor subunit TctC
MKSRAESATVFAVATLLCLASAAHAQTWPARPVRMIIPNSAGSGPDVVVRILGARLERSLGQTFVVDNRPGANFFLASEAVAKAVPDGYTLGLGSGVVASVNPNTFKTLPYNPDRDFDYIAMLVDTAWSLVGAHPSVPASNLSEFIALAKKSPGKYSYQVTVPNVGMWFKWFTHKVGMDLVEVEYKSSPQAVQDMLAGRTDLFVNSITNYTEHLKAGKLKPLAFISSQVPPGFENVQNVRQILPGASQETWIALMGPAGLPPAMVQRLNTSVDAVLKDPEFKSRLVSLGWDNVNGARTPAAIAEHARKERAYWAEIVKEAGVVPQ